MAWFSLKLFARSIPLAFLPHRHGGAITIPVPTLPSFR